LFKDKLSSPIAAVVRSDYRMDGKEEIIICSDSGEIRVSMGLISVIGY